MANVIPFRAMKYNFNKAGRPETLVSPPYDIISEAQHESLLEANPYNVVRLELPRGEDKYAEAGRTLSDWLSEEVLECDTTPSFYIYEEEFSDSGARRSVHGIIGRVRLEPFENGVILPHENTLSHAKTDRFNLMCATGCNFSQIYSLYDDNGKIAPMLESLKSRGPDMEFGAPDGIIHRLWQIPEGDETHALTEAFEPMRLYIADGHHRYETALNYQKRARQEKAAVIPGADYVMMMLVDMNHPGLAVYPTHRLVHSLPDFDADKLLEKAGKNFDVSRHEDISGMESRLGGIQRAAALVTSPGEYFILRLRSADALRAALPKMSEAYRSLDVAMLHSLILEPILGINPENMQKQTNLSYTRDIGEAVSGVKSGAYQCAFIMNATRVEQIRDVSKAGEKMPQKSTYFYPKLITGLVMNKF